MPTECIADLFGFAPVEGRRVEASFDGGMITSDAGGLLLGSTDRAIALIESGRAGLGPASWCAPIRASRARA